jgi:hypothetical protein
MLKHEGIFSGSHGKFRPALSMSSEIILHLAPRRGTLHLLVMHTYLLYVVNTFVGFHSLSVISGLPRDADEICAILGCYTASNGNPLPTFRDNISVPSSTVKKSKESSFLFFLDFLTLEDGTDTLCRNVGKGLPFDAV